MHPSLGRAALFAATAIVALPCGGEEASADDALRELMHQLAARRHDHADFVEQQTIGILDRPTESSGELFYDAPDRLEKRTLRPKSASAVLEHGTLKIHRGKHDYSLAVKDYPQVAVLLDSIRATLAGDLPALTRTFVLDYARDRDGWTLALVPRDRTLADMVSKITLSGSHDEVRTIAYERANGDHSLMTMQRSALP